MKVIKCDGTRRMYTFGDGTEISYDNQSAYMNKKYQRDDTVIPYEPVKPIQTEIDYDKIVKKSVKKKKPCNC